MPDRPVTLPQDQVNKEVGEEIVKAYYPPYSRQQTMPEVGLRTVIRSRRPLRLPSWPLECLAISQTRCWQ